MELCLKKRKYQKYLTWASLTGDHDPVPQVNPQTLWAVSCRNYFLSVSLCRRKCAQSVVWEEKGNSYMKLLYDKVWLSLYLPGYEFFSFFLAWVKCPSAVKKVCQVFKNPPHKNRNTLRWTCGSTGNWNLNVGIQPATVWWSKFTLGCVQCPRNPI